MKLITTIALVAAFALSLVGVVALSDAGCGACGAAPEPQAPSTPAVSATTPFQVLDVTGPAKGQKLCYICRYGGRPSLVVFTRRTDGHFPELVKAIDRSVADNKAARMAGFVVLLGENSEANRAGLTKLATDLGLTIPLTIAADGAKGPAAYGLDGHFDTLVLVSNRNKVLDSVALHCDAKQCDSKACAGIGRVAQAAAGMLKGI